MYYDLPEVLWLQRWTNSQDCMRKEMFLENEKYNEWGCMVMGVFTVKMILYAIIAQSSDRIVGSL